MQVCVCENQNQLIYCLRVHSMECFFFFLYKMRFFLSPLATREENIGKQNVPTPLQNLRKLEKRLLLYASCTFCTSCSPACVNVIC